MSYIYFVFGRGFLGFCVDVVLGGKVKTVISNEFLG